MKEELDLDRIAQGLGAERVGKVKASAGHLGAAQLAAEVARRFRAPTEDESAADQESPETDASLNSEDSETGPG